MITRLKLSTIEQGLPKYRSMLAGNPAYVPPAFESIATVTGNGSATTLTFSSIPGTYQHLQIRGIVKRTGTSTTTANFDMQFNSDTATNYQNHYLQGDGAAVSAGAGANQNQCNIYSTIVGSGTGMTNILGVLIIDILDYASTSKYKTVRTLSGADLNTTNGTLTFSSSAWRSTSALTSITFTAPSAFTTSSTIALYGIKGA